MKRLIPVALLTALLAGCAHDSPCVPVYDDQGRLVQAGQPGRRDRGQGQDRQLQQQATRRNIDLVFQQVLFGVFEDGCIGVVQIHL